MADSKNNKNENRSRNIFNKAIESLNAITKSSKQNTYGVSQDIPGVLSDDLDYFVNKMSADIEKDKSVLNSHMSKIRMKKDFDKKVKDLNIYDIIKDKDIMSAVQSMIGSENMKFSTTLKDYEIIKRCIPQVHRTIVKLVNSILSPDSMGDNNIVGISTPTSISDKEKKDITKLLKKYDIHKRLRQIVMEYLITSVKYITVVPYSIIPDMLHDDTHEESNLNKDQIINEAIDFINKADMFNDRHSLLEASGGFDVSDVKTICESVMGSAVTENINDYMELRNTTNDINDILSNIEFVNGGLSYFKESILNEAISNKTKDNSMTRLFSLVEKTKKDKSVGGNTNDGYSVVEGLIDDKAYKELQKKVEFKGAHLEYLDAAKVVCLKKRSTLIGYFYVEDIAKDISTKNYTSVMDKINSSVYLRQTKEDKGKEVEAAVIKTISDKLIKAVNPKFINNNYDDMDIIYEFVRDNELYKKGKRVVFFHKDDVCEFRREDGSIMKNAMFFAKLLILVLLHNIITKVNRGSDRQVHYVNSGLDTDIAGNVTDAIRAIKQNQIRFSDIGTINEIFNVVGHGVDLFMPVSADDVRPIQTETIAGQDVDMNSDFIQFLIRSIIQSFGVPAGVIDDMESVEFAKTLAMGNIDVAKLVFDAQVELTEPLSKMLRLIIKYEMPDVQCLDEIYAKLNPPSAIVNEINNERVGTAQNIIETISQLVVAPEQEPYTEKVSRMLKLELMKGNVPTIDWSKVDGTYNNIRRNAKVDIIEDDLISKNNADMLADAPQGISPESQGQYDEESDMNGENNNNEYDNY